MQRVIGIIVGVLILFWIISSPSSAASTVNNVLGDLASVGDSIVTFLTELI